MKPKGEKSLLWLRGEIKTPPFSREGRVGAGFLLRRLQQGENLSLPHSRPMPTIGRRCHELRIQDKNTTWRIIYRVDRTVIVILEVFAKKTQKTPKHILDNCQRRLHKYRAFIDEDNSDG